MYQLKDICDQAREIYRVFRESGFGSENLVDLLPWDAKLEGLRRSLHEEAILGQIGGIPGSRRLSWGRAGHYVLLRSLDGLSRTSGRTAAE
jgi:hypothetical protein